MLEITSEEQNKVKRMKRTEDSLRYPWDNIKHTIRIIGVPEEAEKAMATHSKKKKKKNSVTKAPSLILFKDGETRTSLVVQWLRIHSAIQGTQVRSLVR